MVPSTRGAGTEWIPIFTWHRKYPKYHLWSISLESLGTMTVRPNRRSAVANEAMKMWDGLWSLECKATHPMMAKLPKTVSTVTKINNEVWKYGNNGGITNTGRCEERYNYISTLVILGLFRNDVTNLLGEESLLWCGLVLSKLPKIDLNIAGIQVLFVDLLLL